MPSVLAIGRTKAAPVPRFGGKRSGLIVSCMGPIENNADLVRGIYKRFADYEQLAPVGNLIVPNCTEPDQLPGAVKEQAKAFAQKLAA